ncbi:LysR family transcriptional regulator [Sinorhizobium meliloti CCNWSX0020]|uniref:LysR family transcriptional regulator n=1 Tax=Sinorhizobium meliloti CCNWSX0020 TaxID=1107881 RepID=H0G9L0_RHIML|nr:LysR family transcriptional regulator [Sinorhizobium meliloti CCNWSX0020]
MSVIRFSYGDCMSTPLDSDLLRTFLAVADTGNLTRAADTVRRTQSAVSMQIRKLEELIGSALFERHSRGVILTDDGRRLADNARRIVSLLDDTAAAMRSPALEGSVRIGISEEYVNSTLPKALGAFAAIHPGVEVTVRQETSMANSAALAAGELDIAVVFEPGGRSRNEVLMVNPTVWATCDQHGAHERRPVPIATYTYAEGGWCDELARRSLQSRGIESRIAYVSRTSGGLIAALISGLAIAPLSRTAIPAGCRELTEEDGFGIIDMTNVVLRTRRGNRSPTVDAMADAIRRAFRAPAEKEKEEVRSTTTDG